MIDRTESRLFWLAISLIAVAYFVGLSTDITTFTKAISQLGYIFTGRNPATGQFANYPH